MSKRHTMRANPRLLAGAVCAVVSLVILPTGGITQTQAQGSAPPIDELVKWLDQQETQWLATVQLQRQPEAAIPLLLTPGRAAQGPHDRWTPALLALAKIGEPGNPRRRRAPRRDPPRGRSRRGPPRPMG